MAASLLGLDPADVAIHRGDSQGTPYSVGGFASRTMIAGAGAIEKAAGQIRDKMLRIAGHILDIDPSALEATVGVVRRRDDPSVQISIQRVSEAAFLGYPLPSGEIRGWRRRRTSIRRRRRLATGPWWRRSR